MKKYVVKSGRSSVVSFVSFFLLLLAIGLLISRQLRLPKEVKAVPGTLNINAPTGTVNLSSPFTLGGTSVTTSGTKLNFVSDVTSLIQSQINTANTSIGTINDNISAANGNIALKANLASPTFTGNVTMPGTGYWNSSGNVGIGTTNPTSKLYIEDVAPVLSLSATSNSRVMTFSPSAGALDLTNGNFNINRFSNYDVSIGHDSTARLGIGVNPSSRLDVGGGVAIGSYAGTNAAPSNGMIISGNVGIGTTGPGATLDVLGTHVAGIGLARIKGNANLGYVSLDTTTAGPSGFLLKSNGVKVGQFEQDGTNVAIYNELYSASVPLFFGTNTGNVGIGTTGPAQKLDVVGSIHFGGVGQNIINTYATLGETASGQSTILGNNVKASTGTSAVIHMGTDAGNYIRERFDTGIAFHTNITSTVGADVTETTGERMRIDLNGNVGIGTTSPQDKLDVVGGSNATWGGRTIVGDDGNYDPQVRMYRWTGGASNYYPLKFVADTTGLHFRSGTPTTLGGETYSTNILSMLYGGNVGIGTTGPGYKLDVQGGQINASGGLCIAGSCQTSWSGLTGYWTRSGTNLYNTNQGDNVGIGTTSPSRSLDIWSNNATPLYVTATSTNDARIGYQINAVTEWLGGIDNSDGDKFKITNGTGIGDFTSTGLTIDTSGNVGIGTTAPGTKLDVVGGVVRVANNDPTNFRGFQAGGSYGLTIEGYADCSAAASILQNAYLLGDPACVGSTAFKWLNTHGSMGSRGIEFSMGTGIQFFADAVATTANTTFTPTERMRITNAGNVGIGTTGPGYKLDVQGGAINASGGFSWNGTSLDSRYMGVTSGTTNYVTKFTGATTIGNSAIYETGGNVGIGTTGPGQKLDVQGGNINTSGNLIAYGIQGNGNVGGTGNASWHPSGIYSAGPNWLYGAIYLNGAMSGGTTANFSGTVTAPTFSGNATSWIGYTSVPTWNQNTTGNAATATNVAWTGITGKPTSITRIQDVTGSYGSMNIAGTTGGYAGFNFIDEAVTFMVDGAGATGILNNSGSWKWYFDTNGALTAGTVPWGRVTGAPAFLTTFTETDPTVPVYAKNMNQYVRTTDSPTFAAVTATTFSGNLSGTFGGLALSGTTNNGVNQVVRTDVNGYTNFGWINTISGDNGTAAIGRVYASGDAYIRYYTLANFSAQVTPTWANVSGKPTLDTTPDTIADDGVISTGETNFTNQALYTSSNPTFGTVYAALSGNATSATTATNLTNFSVAHGVNPDTKGTTGIHYFAGGATSPYGDGALYQQAYQPAATTWGSQIMQDYRTGRLAVRGLNNTNWTTWLNVIDSGNIASQTVAAATGNAGSATVLQTARTIWGQSFNGSANISGAITGATTGTFSSTVTAPTFTANNTILTTNRLYMNSGTNLHLDSFAGGITYINYYGGTGGVNICNGANACGNIYWDVANSGLRVPNNYLVNGDIYFGTRSAWLSSWLNQSVTTGANPTFGTVYAALSGNATTATNVAYSGLTGTVPTWNQNTTGNAASATSALRIVYNDGPRNLSDRLPNSFTRAVNFDFVGAGTGNGTGNYAGVMTYSPWAGTTSSTGDSSYQLAFANASGVNASGPPKLSIRNGIDSTWNGWKQIITDDGAGNVGIGTTSPGTPLHIGTTGWSANQLHFSSGWAAAGYHATIGSGYSGTTAGGIMLGSPHVPWRASYGAKVRFASDQSATASWDWGMNGEAGGSTDRFDLNRNNVNFLSVTNGGNVGIGTTAPASKLSVGGVGNANYAIYGAGTLAGVYGTSSGSGSGVNGAGTGTYTYGVYGTGYIGVYGINGGTTAGYGVYGSSSISGGTGGYFTSSAGPALITNAGNVGIGTTAPGYKLEVAGTVYASGSSIKFKQNVKDLEVNSEKIYDLRPVSFDYKPDYKSYGKDLGGGRQIGLIAEEVYKTIPELSVKLGNEISNVDYEKLSVLLLDQVQKQKKTIDNQQEKVDTLEKRLDLQQEQINKLEEKLIHDK